MWPGIHEVSPSAQEQRDLRAAHALVGVHLIEENELWPMLARHAKPE
jgi:hypothetical protein